MANAEPVRTRHPSGKGWKPDLVRLTARVADELTAEGAEYPETGAAALAVRGVGGLERTAFAAETGVPAETLAAVEEGHVPPADVPAAVRRRGMWIRWETLDQRQPPT